ncbi:MAG: UDP-N-acetylmuramoyl-L-alanine--D-glutamate ligase, partial [Chlorobiales bacterium]|nr:UDP-N-acetylmuramoyl-L-alanine--D-glutamate ligase [Chlorobiales bacterium]
MAATIKPGAETEVNSRETAAEPTLLVLGMGETGVSCARHFAARGITAEVADSRATPPGMKSILDIMPDARLQMGSQLTELGSSIRRIVVSPGVDLDVEVIRKGKARGVEIVSDIDLFFEECRVPVIAITGSNGKSTVTSMVASMLSAAGWSAAAGANLGIPALDLLGSDVDVYVLELSSFQLERSRPVSAEVAVLLNITPDHLDRHGYMAEYRAAKERIYLGCRKAVVNRDFPDLASAVPTNLPVTGFTLGDPLPGEFGIRHTEAGAYLACGEALLMPREELPVAGKHNVANALAALALGASVGADLYGLAAGLKNFRGMPHRMQTVSHARGATWIDDSKATNVAAASMSIGSVPDPLILIAGGEGKGADFDELAKAL